MICDKFFFYVTQTKLHGLLSTVSSTARSITGPLFWCFILEMTSYNNKVFCASGIFDHLSCILQFVVVYQGCQMAPQ